MFECINGWTKKKMITKVKKEFKGKSENSNGRCEYRSKDKTKKCGVGIFIPAKVYNDTMDEGMNTAAEVVIQDYKPSEIMPLKDYTMRYFQERHDTLNGESPISFQLDELIDWIYSNVKD